MIHLKMRVSEVLQRYPALLDELIAASPAFAKLKNPLLRRAMPRLVNLAQAARMGGLEPQELVNRLNQALGLAANQTSQSGPESLLEAQSKLGTPSPTWLRAAIGFHLDVRPVLEAGGEPFQAIMGAAHKVLPGERLVLEAPFEPLPLYRVMSKKGFEAWCEQIDEHYRVHFYRTPHPPQTTPAQGPSEPAQFNHDDWNRPDAVVQIEAQWEPPLPMQAVLEALSKLTPGQRLLVHHVRRPVHLLARLEQEGMPYELRDLGPNRVDLLIEKR